MERVRVDDLDPAGGGVDCHRLSEPLGTTGVAINRYRLASGQGFPGGLHAHADQEEVFYVLAGTATFETMEREGAVEAGAAIRFAQGEFHSGRNDAGADEDLVVLALGAPRDTDDVRVPVACPDCGYDVLRVDGGKLVCPDCGAGHVPEPCLDCGHELEATLDGTGNPIVACPDCGSEFETAPIRE